MGKEIGPLAQVSDSWHWRILGSVLRFWLGSYIVDKLGSGVGASPDAVRTCRRAHASKSPRDCTPQENAPARGDRSAGVGMVRNQVHFAGQRVDPEAAVGIGGEQREKGGCGMGRIADRHVKFIRRHDAQAG